MGFDFFVMFFRTCKHSREPHKILYISEKKKILEESLMSSQVLEVKVLNSVKRSGLLN